MKKTSKTVSKGKSHPTLEDVIRDSGKLIGKVDSEMDAREITTKETV